MDNADLEKLKVSVGKLIPKFKASVTDYTVTLGSAVPELKLTVLTSDSGASYAIKGIAGGEKVVRIEEGQSLQVEIVVTAEDGSTTKSYFLKIARLCADDAKLSQLDISVGTLHPCFNPAIHNYECSLTSNVDTLTMRAKTEEETMKLSVADGSPVGTIKLNPGRTVCVLQVESANGSKKTEYIVIFNKNPLPSTLQLKTPNERFECAVCCCVVSMSSRIDKGPFVYCKNCLEGLTRYNKVDPFTGSKLDEEPEWLKLDFKRDNDLGNEEGICPLPSGKVERPVNQIGAKIMVERLKAAETAEPTEACKACSKKVPRADIALHGELLCTVKHPIALTKKEAQVKARTWEKRLVDETIGTNASELVTSATQWEEKYLKSLPYPGEPDRKKVPLGYLMKASRAYATAIHSSPKEGKYHIALGLVLEELFYAEDLYGLAPELPLDSEDEARTSSKEEEFLAICKIHGVPPSAPIALQLKAVEAEYQSLKETGETHKADHVQALYAWKSKKVLEADQGSYAVDKESPLYKAKIKYQDAVHLNPSDGVACYHLGRICLLMGDRETAKQYLLAAVALKPTLSPARFCLGIALPAASKDHAKRLLLHGLSQYLAGQQLLHEANPEPQKITLKELHASKFYHSSNTLIAEGFLQLSSYSGHGHLTIQCCLLSVTSCVARAYLQHRASTYHRLLWSSLKARAILLTHLHKEGSSAASRHCKQLSTLISCSGLESSALLREMQMEVFQLGVLMEPSCSEALWHLGNGQLSQYEACEEEQWLKDAELSFRASIAMEGKVSPTLIPEKLKEQEWWKKSNTKDEKACTATTSTATKQLSVAGRGKPGAPTTSRTQPGAGRAATSKVGAGAASKVGVGASRKTSVESRGSVGAAKVAPTKRTSTGGTSTTGGKRVVTLGELKTMRGTTASKGKEPLSSSKGKDALHSDSPKQDPTTAAPTEEQDEKINTPSYLPRLGLARTLSKTDDPKKQHESRKLYKEVMKMSPDFHDAYIELGEILSKYNPAGAVEVYARFPFNNPPTFDDAYLHGEIIRLLMKSENYDNACLITSMIAMGTALGIGVLDKQVAILEGKFKYPILKKVYAGVHRKPVDDPDLMSFFKFKCWL